MRCGLAALAMIWAGVAPAQDFTTLKGHGGPIMALAVSPEGRVASASFDNSVGVWRGRAPHWLEGHDAAVTSLAWGPRGVLASGGDDFAVRLWEVDREAPPDQVRGRQGQARGAGGRASGGDALGRHRGKVAALAFAPSGDWLASGSWDGSVWLWSLTGGRSRELPQPGAGVNALAFDGEDRLLAATSAGEVLIYDLASGAAPLPLVRHGFGVNTLVLGAGWIAYGAVDGGTRVVDLRGHEIADFTLERRPILAMDWHRGTARLAVGDGQGYIMMVDTESWQITRDFRATREGPVWALGFGPEGQMIYAGGIDDVAYGWPVASLDSYAPGITGGRSFLRDAGEMGNGERQFMRKCSICHALAPGPSRKAGPTLHGVFGRRAGTVPGYAYSDTLDGSGIVWSAATIDALFDAGPDHYIPGSKMPMQVIAGARDRADLIAFLKTATTKEAMK